MHNERAYSSRTSANPIQHQPGQHPAALPRQVLQKRSTERPRALPSVREQDGREMTYASSARARSSKKPTSSKGSSKPHVLDGGSEAFRKLNGLPSLSSTKKSEEPSQPMLFENGLEKPMKRNGPQAKRPKKPSAGSKLEAQFAVQCRAMLSDELQPVREHRFHPTRLWRFDFAWPAQKVSLEVEGGMFSTPVSCHRCKMPVLNKFGHRVMAAAGRHSRKAGFDADCEKYNEAAVLGWRVLRTTNTGLDDGTALKQVIQALSA